MSRRTPSPPRPRRRGEFDTSTTTEAPFSTSASPSPVRVLTPELGDAATTSCPCLRSLLTSFDPMSPLPPITTVFIIVLSFSSATGRVESEISLGVVDGAQCSFTVPRLFRRYFTGTNTGAPLCLTKNTRNFAGLVLLAFRLTM